MTPTDDLRTWLRAALNEKIPQGGSDADTRFTPAEIDSLLSDAKDKYAAASDGWLIKAGMLQRKMNEAPATQGYSIGNERYDLAKLKEEVEMCLSMAQHYAKLSSNKRGSAIVKVAVPVVIDDDE